MQRTGGIIIQRRGGTMQRGGIGWVGCVGFWVWAGVPALSDMCKGERQGVDVDGGEAAHPALLTSMSGWRPVSRATVATASIHASSSHTSASGSGKEWVGTGRDGHG